MKKNNYIPFVIILLFSLSIQAQTKQWTLEECIKYAIDNNISIKQTELDTKFKRYDFVDTPKGVKFISKSVTIDIPFNSDKTSIFDIVKKIENGK